MKPARKAYAILAAALAALAGCGREAAGYNWSPAPDDPGGESAALYRDASFPDLPVPEAYRLIEGESHSFQGRRSRSGVFHYRGRLDWLDAADFFRRRLPEAGWNQVSIERGGDFRELRFRKGGEQLILVIRRLRDGSRAELQLDDVERNDLLLRGRLPKPPENR
ncbi:MAG: hypothetical protein LBU64_00180 [Planctomycetota bacterium]|jgi:hypothetical protein|nr:hypothetical protein [Planctomycetota bacterium]